MKDCRISSSIATGTLLLLLGSMRCYPRRRKCWAPRHHRRSAAAWPPLHPGADGAARFTSDVQVLHAERVLLDEAAPRFDLVTHQRGEDLVCLVGVLDADLQQRARLGIHRRRPELLR